jgi:hypothetical protein
MAGLTIDDPITLHRAWTGEHVIPGDTLVLRAGTYSANHLSRILGSIGNPVIVKPYNNERVILSGPFHDYNAKYITYIDLEFTSDRDPLEQYNSTKGHDFSGEGVKVINCIMHDSHGGAAWDLVDLVYGCISYNQGTFYNGAAHGHSLYSQNQDASHKKTIKHSIFGRSANYGLHGYATNFHLVNYDAIENVLLPGGTHLIGSLGEDEGITIQGNHVFGSFLVGYGHYDHTDLTCEDNIFFKPNGYPFTMGRWLSGSVTGNTFISGTPGVPNTDLFIYGASVGTPSGLIINENSYYSRSGKTQVFVTNGVPPYWLDLATWQSLYGFDADSTIVSDGSGPNNITYLYPNEYADVSRRKGLVVIWNWSESASVSVDLSSLGIAAGTACRLLQAQDPLGDQRAFTMPANGIISVTMSGTIASVTGWADPATTFPAFGAFVVETP